MPVVIFPYASESSLTWSRTEAADEIDQTFPNNSEFSIDKDGVPHLRRLIASVTPANFKYIDLIANAIMLHNVVDLTSVLNEMNAEGNYKRASGWS